MPRCVIFTAGDQHGIEKHEIGLRHDDFVICCDAGYRLAQRLGVRPDLAIKRLRTHLPVRFENERENCILHGVVLEINEKTGKTNKIIRHEIK